MKQELKEKMLREAVLVKVNSYSPYSKFRVGACVATKSGELICGVNVESASYPCGICAERSALFACYSMGYRHKDIEEIIVCTNNEIPSSPCGACRQVIYELMDKDALVTLINPRLENTISLKVRDLLPYGFDGEKLNEA